MEHRDLRRSFSGGELSPGLEAGEDLALFKRSLLTARNIVIDPTGGFTDRGGFRHVCPVRNRIVAIAIPDGAVTTQPSGEVIVDIDPITLEPIIVVTDPVVPDGGGMIVQVDFGTAVLVHLVDIINFSVSGAQAFDSWRIEYSSNGSVWTAFGETFDAYPEAASRRASLAPRTGVSARYWRLAGLVAIEARTFQVPELRFWRETANRSNVQAYGFAFDVNDDYLLIHTDRNVEVISNGARVTAVASPHPHAIIPEVSEAQSLDTLLMFHQDHAPWRIFKQRGDGEWDSRAQAFTNIPSVQFPGETYTNGVNELQSVLLLRMTAGTDQFVLRFKGQASGSITYAGDNATTTGNISTALQATSTIGSGNVSVTKIGVNLWQAEFTGDLGQSPQPIMSFAFIGPGDGDEVMEVQRIREGRKGGEAIMSAARGWPACGRFFQSRLALGGFRSRPASVLFSAQGFFDLDIEIEEADGGILFAIDDDQMKRIRRFWSADHFQIFTDDAEFWIADRVIAKGTPFSFAKGTGRGIRFEPGLIEADDRVMFVQRDGQALRSFIFSDAEQSYVSPNLSRLSPHLIRNPVSMAAQRGLGPANADMVFLANEDGNAAVMGVLGDEEFGPLVRWDTQGTFKAFGVEGRTQVYAIVQRTVDGVTTLYCERYETDFLYDAGYRRDGGSAISSVTGLTWLEGKTVQMWLDGRPWGEAVVTGGAVTLPVAASRIQIGLPFDVTAELTPIVSEGAVSVFDRPMRIHETVLSLIDTGSVTVAVNGGAARKVSLRRFGPDALSSVDDTLFTGEARVRGLPGYARRSRLTIGQEFRAPLRVRGVMMQGRSS